MFGNQKIVSTEINIYQHFCKFAFHLQSLVLVTGHDFDRIIHNTLINQGRETLIFFSSQIKYIKAKTHMPTLVFSIKHEGWLIALLYKKLKDYSNTF